MMTINRQCFLLKIAGISVILGLGLLYCAGMCFAADDCSIPVPCPQGDGASYQLKVQTQARAGGTLRVPDLGLAIQTPFNDFPVELKRLMTPACRAVPGAVCPNFSGTHLLGMNNWPLPAQAGREAVVDSMIFGQVTLRLGAGNLVYVDAVKSLTGDPGGSPFQRIYACWDARVGGKSAQVPYQDQFGKGIAALKRTSYVCFGARYDQAEGTGTLLCSRASGNPLPDQYTPGGQPVFFRAPFVQGLFSTDLEGLDEWCEDVHLVTVQ
jgi:hypothetical protein